MEEKSIKTTHPEAIERLLEEARADERNKMIEEIEKLKLESNFEGHEGIFLTDADWKNLKKEKGDE